MICELDVASWRVRADQSDEHGNDFEKRFFSFLSNNLAEQGLCHKDVETGCTFKGGCPGSVKESTAIRRRKLAVSFGDIEGNRCGRAIELVMNGKVFGNVHK